MTTRTTILIAAAIEAVILIAIVVCIVLTR